LTVIKQSITEYNMGTYKQLFVWKKADELVRLVYRATDLLPMNEKFGLISQMNRAAISITSNLAEGSGSSSGADQLRYYGYAYASAVELDSQIRMLEHLGLVHRNVIAGLDAAMSNVLPLIHLLRRSNRNRQLTNLKT